MEVPARADGDICLKFDEEGMYPRSGTEGRYKGFLDEIERAAGTLSEILESGDPSVLLVSHYDADGLSAASLLEFALRRMGIFNQVKIVDQLTPEFLSKVLSLQYDVYVFTDLGSGIREWFRPRRDKLVFIIDHHKPVGSFGKNKPIEINPIEFGIDGSAEVSSSVLAYLFSRSLHRAVDRLLPVSLLGALGDRQDVGQRFSLTGINRMVLEEGKRKGMLIEEIGLRLFGAGSRPLVKSLAYTFDPFIPGISGDEAASLNFLKRIGVKPSDDGALRTLASLSPEETRRLVTELVKYMLERGLPVKEAERIFGTRYIISVEPKGSPLRDAREYSYMLNACGRLGYYGTGIGLCMGRRGAVLAKALEHGKEYRRILAKVFRALKSGWDSYAREFDYLVYVDLGDLVNERLTGAVASILASSRGVRSDKLVVLVGALSVDNRKKISARVLARSTDQLHIGEIMSATAREVGGVGGGHLNAGGATVAVDSELKFVRKVDELLRRAVKGWR